MKSEMDSMSESKVWTVSNAPKRVKQLGANRFSMMKTDKEGKVLTYKAMLGEKVINKVNVLTMMKLVHQLLW